jgi:hypothetical protein
MVRETNRVGRRDAAGLALLLTSCEEARSFLDTMPMLVRIA